MWTAICSWGPGLVLPCAILPAMPLPSRERHALERERDELPAHIANTNGNSTRRLRGTGHQGAASVEIRRDQKRLTEIYARLAAIGTE